MAQPPHRIQRLVLAAHAGRQAQAQAFSQALHSLLLPRLLPLVASACDALAGPNTLLCIDRLEIDLGQLPAGSDALANVGGDGAAALADIASRRLAELLPARLAQAASAQAPVDQAAALLRQFAATGTLPWWADGDAAGLLNQAMDSLLASPGAAAAARGLLRDLAGQADAWRRLLLGLQQGQRRSPQALDPDSACDRLLLALHPQWPGLAGARLLALGGLLANHPALSAAELARRWWPALLASAGQGLAPPQLLSQALGELAATLATPAPGLWLAWRRSDAWQTPAALTLAELVDRQWPVAASQAAPPEPAGPPGDDAELAGWLRSWVGTGPQAQAFWGRLAGLLPRLPPGLRQAAAALPRLDRAGAYAGATPSAAASAATAALASLAEAAMRQGLLGARALAEALAALPSPCPDALAAVAAQLRQRPGPADPPPPTLDDSLHLDNAGIVLLWPFLPPFFARLGLTRERAFVDEPAAQVALRLLHWLASGDPDPAEQQLPLCKLLCGLDLLAPLDEAAALGADMLAQAQDLLQAVVAQAEVLAGLSIDGLRGSFLLRAGQLSALDDHHLLRVERQSWDILLARLPWACTVVKLPWMPRLLQVQW